MSTDHYQVGKQKGKSAYESSVLYISSAKYGGDWHSAPHSHTFTELFYVVGGKGGFQIENDIYPVKAQDIVVVNPNVMHTETSLDASPLEYIVLGVEGLALSADEISDGRFFILSFRKNNDAVRTCMEMMLNEVEQKHPGFDSVCQNLLQVIIIQLMRQLKLSAEVTVKSTRKECAAAKWYIDKHFKEKLTLDQLARVTGISKFHLVHSFTEEYGVSPIRYMTQRKIEESKYLLASTDLPLGTIVKNIGFSSSSYFAQMFRREMEMSPSEYREMSRMKR